VSNTIREKHLLYQKLFLFVMKYSSLLNLGYEHWQSMYFLLGAWVHTQQWTTESRSGKLASLEDPILLEII